MPDGQAELVKVADGAVTEIAAALEDGLFEGLNFKPTRSYADWKDDELEDLDCLNVDVVPVEYVDSSLEDRGSVGYLCSFDIGVREKFSPGGRIKIAEIDRLI